MDILITLLVYFFVALFVHRQFGDVAGTGFVFGVLAARVVDVIRMGLGKE